jgi:4-hydroxy-2-oxoheptanedioate aldolase
MIGTNTLKAKLKKGEGVVGAFNSLPSPDAVEILAFMGMDFVIIDAEHGVATLESCEHQVRAAEAVGISTMMRIALNMPQNILRHLDTGVMGAQIPQVDTAEEARAVVDAVRYPPQGKRGLAGVRAAGYGVAMPLGDYVKQANEELILCVQIETTKAIGNAAEILAVDGVDLVFLGPTDISSSMGYPGQPTHPEVMEAIEHVGKAAVSAGKWAGTIARNADAYEHWRNVGYQYLCTGVVNLLADGAKQFLENCRERESAGA